MLVVRHTPLVYRIGYRLLRRREDAEDAAQETFIRSWRALGSFDPQREFVPWLARIASNTALTMLSRRKDGRVVEMDAEATDKIPDARAVSSSDAAGGREVVRTVERLVASLPAEQSLLFHLRYREEMPIEQIAEATGRKPGAVAVMLHRMRERFRGVIYGDGGGREQSGAKQDDGKSGGNHA